MDAIIKALILKDMKARLVMLNAKDEVIGNAPWVGVAAVKQWIDIIERQA